MTFAEWQSLAIELKQLVFDVFAQQTGPLKTAEKDKFDYVTGLDLEIQEKVAECLASRYREHAVIGEESVEEIIRFAGDSWLIDPLDGTSNYVFGLPFVSCSIAFVSGGKVQAALVVDPLRRDVFEAFRGLGARINGERLDCRENSSDFIGVSTGFLAAAAAQHPEALLTLSSLGKFRLLGSQALHLCYVAAGRFKACINLEAKAWDDIAGALIVQESGGRYSSRAQFDIDELGDIKATQNLFSMASAAPDLDLESMLKKIELEN